MRKRKAVSPYTKYGKTPYRYSDLFGRICEAWRQGNSSLAAKLGRDHSLRYIGPDWERNARRGRPGFYSLVDSSWVAD